MSDDEFSVFCAFNKCFYLKRAYCKPASLSQILIFDSISIETY